MREQLLQRLARVEGQFAAGSWNGPGIRQLLTDVAVYLTAEAGQGTPPAAVPDAIGMAIKHLSYTELAGVKAIAQQMEADNDCIVASRIANAGGFTNSTIVSALSKLNSAGIIESRSMGQRGMHIKTLIPGWRERIGAAG